MRKLIALLVLALPCFAQQTMPVLGSTFGISTKSVALFFGGTSIASTRFFSTNGINASEGPAQILSPITGKITAMYVAVAAAPASTDVMSIRVGGSQVLACTVATSAHSCSATGGSTTITKGSSLIAAECVCGTSTTISMYVRVEGVTGLTTVLPFMAADKYSSGTTRNWSVSEVFPSQTSGRINSPLTGTITDLQVGSATVAGAGGELFTVFDVTSSLVTCLLAASNTASSCTSLSGAITKGDLMNVSAPNNSGASQNFGTWALVTTPKNANVIPFTAYASLAASTTGYISGGAISTGAESDVDTGSPISGAATELYCFTSAAAAGTGTVFTLNIAGSPSALTCTVTSGNTVCSATGQLLQINQGDLLSATVINSNTTTATWPGCYVRVE